MNEKEWIPEDYILENNLLNNNIELYDKYCDYVKWKKNNINMIKVWCMLYKNDKLIDEIYEYFMIYIKKTDNKYKNVIDYILEILYVLLKNNNKKEILEKMLELNKNDFELSSKFLLLNINDIIFHSYIRID